MSNTQFKAFKETALPSQLQAHAIYLIAPTGKDEYVELYVTDASGRARRHFNENDARTLFGQLASAKAGLSVVETISARNLISNPLEGSEVFVKNATEDSTVSSGGARYLRVGSSWIKVSETEAMDLRLSWDSLDGRPNSSPTQIDQAVQNAHSHTNKTQLDKISEDATGNLTYGGQAVKTQWANVGW